MKGRGMVGEKGVREERKRKKGEECGEKEEREKRKGKEKK
jgi:hypothetical protein